MTNSKKLSRSFINKINTRIKELSCIYELDIFDFDISYDDENNKTVFLNIKHKAYPSYVHFTGVTDDLENALFSLAPFEHVTYGELYEPIENVHEILERWFRNFLSELHALHEEELNQKAKLISDKIAPYLQTQITEPDECFNDEELKSLKDRLDALEAHFEQQKTAYSLTQESLSGLKDVIEEIKHLAETEKQQRWYDKTLHKLGDWAGRIEKIDKVVRAIEKGSSLLDKLPL